jgi:hypothetical protein
LLEHLWDILLEKQRIFIKAKMDMFVSCVAWALLIFCPARVEKKKVEVPKYKLIWRRKELQPPRVVSSRAGQEGGCGVEGKQDLKTVNMSGAIVDILPPF